MGDVIFYVIGAAVVLGVSGLVDFGSLFSSNESPDEDTPQTAPQAEAEAEQVPAELAREFQSTLAHFLEDEPQSLISLRDAERAAEEKADAELFEHDEDDETPEVVEVPDPEPAPDVMPDPPAAPEDWASYEPDNIFEGGESAVAEDALTVYDVTDPEHDPAHIADFDGEAEALQIEYLAQFDPETGEIHVPALGVDYDRSADMTRVTLDGTAVAELEGHVPISPDDIELRAMA